MDEERLRLERADRKNWKSRVTGLEDYGPSASDATLPPSGSTPRSRRNGQRQRAPGGEDDDLEFKLALEASKNQMDEDEKRRGSKAPSSVPDDDDLVRAIKLSEEEDAARRRELENKNAISLFDDDPIPVAAQPQATGWNQGYQQQSAVDWFGNPIDQQQQQQQQPQTTGYLDNSYMQPQQTGFQPDYNAYNQYMQPQQTGYQAQYMQPQQTNYAQPQQTGYNNDPYGQAQQAGHNNPFSANNGMQDLRPQPTGSNNPFASTATRQTPQQSTPNRAPTLSTLQEQRTAQPQKEMDPHQARLNALLASGEGMDTFGNVGNTRIPAQHTAPGTFVNSYGANQNKLVAEKTGTNPFMHNQFTGAPQAHYAPQQQPQMPHQQYGQNPYGQQGMMPMQTGPAGYGGSGYGQQSSNPFGQQQTQQQGGPGSGSLIDL